MTQENKDKIKKRTDEILEKHRCIRLYVEGKMTLEELKEKGIEITMPE